MASAVGQLNVNSSGLSCTESNYNIRTYCIIIGNISGRKKHFHNLFR